ncbi:MAG: hypothetical protein AAB926_01435 [Patescibacteria group bacterium]
MNQKRNLEKEKKIVLISLATLFSILILWGLYEKLFNLATEISAAPEPMKPVATISYEIKQRGESSKFTLMLQLPKGNIYFIKSRGIRYTNLLDDTREAHIQTRDLRLIPTKGMSIDIDELETNLYCCSLIYGHPTRNEWWIISTTPDKRVLRINHKGILMARVFHQDQEMGK